MDFIAAGSLLNLSSALKSADKSVELRSPSPLLATLFVTMGFTAYVKMARRKH
jgi:anti-anti-sigma regulatory factor